MSLREDRLQGFREAGQPIHTGHKAIRYATPLQVRKDR